MMRHKDECCRQEVTREGKKRERRKTTKLTLVTKNKSNKKHQTIEYTNKNIPSSFCQDSNSNYTFFFFCYILTCKI